MFFSFSSRQEAFGQEAEHRRSCGTFSGEVLSSVHGPSPQLVDQVVHGVLVTQEEWPDHPLI